MSDIVERLCSVDVSWSETGEWCAEAAHVITELRSENARLNDAMREAINTVSDLARKVGEAEGKLAISETAGVLDGWMAENARLLASVKAWAADAARHSDNADYWRQECQMLRAGLERIATGNGIGGPDAELQCANIARAALAGDSHE